MCSAEEESWLLFLVPFWTPPPSDRKSATNYGSGQKKEEEDGREGGYHNRIT